MNRKILFILLLCFSGTGHAIGKYEYAPEQLLQKIRHNQVDMIIDLREKEDFDEGHIPGAKHINVTDLGKEMSKLLPYRNRDVVIYCGDGTRAAIGMIRLHKEGFSHVYNVHGNLNAWKRKQLPLEKPARTNTLATK